MNLLLTLLVLTTPLAVAGCGAGSRHAATADAEDADADVDAGRLEDAGARDADAGDAGAGDGAVPPPLPPFLSDPAAAFPERLSETGLYAAAASRLPAPWVTAYEPAWPLWSNGLRKERFVYAPMPVDNTDTAAWEVAEGTVFYKTFVDPATEQPVETRIIRRSVDAWDYVAYQWNRDRADALLLAPTASIDVELEIDGSQVLHRIPSKLECRACHESAPSPVLGFDEVQLGGALAELAALFVEPPPAHPATIEHPDGATREVLGYLHGNCVPCHNGSAIGPNSSFDLRHDVALANLIDVPTATSGVEAGIRVIPGNPAESVMIRALARETEDPMPPFGVQIRDETALEVMTAWVAGLPR